MDIKIRKSIKEDCPRLLELIHELAVYEKASNEVPVTPEHFVESGFGKNPVWWAFVATSPSNSLSKGEGEPISLSNSLSKGEGEPDSEKKEIIVGFALYYISYSTWKG